MLRPNSSIKKNLNKKYPKALNVLSKAWNFSKNAHLGQKRKSGEIYFSHPVAVAAILSDLDLDISTIITALLHDVVEDCNVTINNIEDEFGVEIANLVDGVTKLSRIETQSDRIRQAENFRKLFLATSNDIRVLLVKLADRTHNMRTIGGIKNPEKRQKIAQETLEIFAPLSERIGITSLKNEMEDLAFAVVQPQMRSSIMNRLSFLETESREIIPQIIEELRNTLKNGGVEVIEITGRLKTPFSIWRKMQRSNNTMDQLSDIMAFRVLVEKTLNCYESLFLIHSKYSSVMGRFKDYISTKKRNGYQSLHTGIIGPFNEKIEVQIKTPEMHSVAESGIASHWVYKLEDKRKEKLNNRWVKDLVSILDQQDGPEDFLENTKMEMYYDQVFCFTPKGDLIALPRGATAVDFAYAVHSDLGHTCVGVKVNGKVRQLKSILENGDQIEILSSSSSTPLPEWESFVRTGRARASIKKFIKQKRQKEFSNVGEAILKKTFRKYKRKFSLKLLEDNLNSFNKNEFSKSDELLASIGEGVLSPIHIIETLFPKKFLKNNDENLKNNISLKEQIINRSKKDTLLEIKGLIPGMAVHYAKCCSPLPGEQIVGIVTTGKGITIHTIDCNTLEKFYDLPERWLDINWDKNGIAHHIGRINIVMTNEPGSLASVTTFISNHGGNISNLQLVNRDVDFFRFLMDVEVEDISHMTNVIMVLRSNPFVERVDRYRG